MPPARHEDALSEVIGFILILALIAALASLYLTYVVPAQGREGEIRHMAGINDQFLGFKTGADSLWINDQANVPISRTFSLGTLTGMTQGSFVVPLFQPYASGGTMVVNGRGESIRIVADALVQGFPGSQAPDLSQVSYEPDHIYVQVRTADLTRGGGITLSPDEGDWTIWLNVTMISTPGAGSPGPVGTVPTPTPSGPGTSAVSWNDLNNWINNKLNPWASDVNSSLSSAKGTPFITMTLLKNGYATVSDLPIVKNVQDNEWYTVDLLDAAYGLDPQLTYPFTLSLDNSTSDWIQYRYPASIGYIPVPIDESHPLGSLEYRSNNNYWIQQDYYYQAGGVFLFQADDQASVAKVLPLISIQNTTGIPYVKIVDVVVEGSGNIGGTSPVQVISRLDSVTEDRIGGSVLASGIPNSKVVTVTIQAQNEPAARMWNQTFANIKRIGGGQSWIANVQSGNSATLTVDPNPSSDEYDLILDYTRVNLTVELQPVAL